MVGDFLGNPAPSRDQDRTFDRLLHRLSEAAAHGTGPGVIIIDVREFDELSPAAAELLERYARSAKLNGNHVVLCGAGGPLSRSLYDAGFDRLLGPANIIETVDGGGGDVEAAYARAFALLRAAERPVAGEVAEPPGGVPAQRGLPGQGSATN